MRAHFHVGVVAVAGHTFNIHHGRPGEAVPAVIRRGTRRATRGVTRRATLRKRQTTLRSPISRLRWCPGHRGRRRRGSRVSQRPLTRSTSKVAWNCEWSNVRGSTRGCRNSRVRHTEIAVIKDHVDVVGDAQCHPCEVGMYCSICHGSQASDTDGHFGDH